MFRKNYFTSLLLVTLFLVGGISVFGQAGKGVSGKIVMKKSDGAKEPVKDVMVEIYRIDSNGKIPGVKTDETGAFSFSDVLAEGTYALSISGAGLNPEIIPDVKAGMDSFEIPVTEGNGKRWTEEQVKLSIFASLKESGKLSDEQKKMLMEFENKKANVAQKNAIVDKALKEGNAAFEGGNYNLAVAKYDEGIDADPEFIGSAPVFLNNKGAALKKRAVENYNEAVKSKDSGILKEAKKEVTKDLADALDSYNKSYLLLSQAPAAEIIDQAKHKQNIFNAADGGRDAIRIMALIKVVDTTKAEAAKTLMKAYMEAEADKNKKGQAQASLASYLLDAGDYDGAVSEYRKAVEFTPDDADVLAGFSLALYTAAEDKQSKDMKQESLNYMEKYLKVAPKDHKLRGDIDGLATYLKTEEKMKPQKIN